MLTKKILGTGLCVVALGSSAVGLYGGDLVMPSVEAQRCADGSCVPRRLTNGFYATTWRRWPIDPPPRAKPGVREGISAPNMELPPPKMETYLPEGVLIAPPPLQDSGSDGGFESAPGDSSPLSPSPGPATPRGDSPEGLPPELRSGQSRLPSNQRMAQRTPRLAAREVNRPAAVIEALRSEAALTLDDTGGRGEGSNVPAALPNDEGQAQPLSAPPAVEMPSIKPKRSIPSSGNHPTSSKPAWQPATSRQPEADQVIDSPGRPVVEQPTASLNAPAAIYARSTSGVARREATRASFSISAADVPAALAIRTVSEQSWGQDSSDRNPLRSRSAETKLAFEYSDPATSQSPAGAVSWTEKPSARETLEIPANPLRK